METKNLHTDPEAAALADAMGIDPKELVKQATGGEPPAGDPPKGDPPAGDPPAGDPPKGGSPAPITVDEKTREQLRGDFLKEIFGDRFKTVDEVKSANISQNLEELEQLRQKSQDLESKLAVKPKSNFVNDEVAIFNEFVRETGINSYEVFKDLSGTDMANIDPMDALVYDYLLKNPSLVGKKVQVRKHLEKKYNVDPNEVDEDTLEVNKIGLLADSAVAKKGLVDLKEKLKVPAMEPDAPAPTKLTEDEVRDLGTKWGVIGKEASTKHLNRLTIPIKGSKDPLLTVVLDEGEQKEINDFIVDYAKENQMPLNEANVKTVTMMVYNQLMLNKLPDIVHSVFEKARNMTKEEVESMYETTNTGKNTDTPPPAGQSAMTEQEKTQEQIFEAEMGAYNH